jgi:hypothetical protein
LEVGDTAGLETCATKAGGRCLKKSSRFVTILTDSSAKTPGRKEDFGLRWQPAGAKRSEDWSAAATPLFDREQNLQSGAAPALRDSRRSPNLCALASLR